jgi:hypothetical protein
MSSLAIRHLAFLTPGNYDDADPRAGLEETLALFEYGEKLGFDSAWVRQRHLEPGVSSSATFLAAASQGSLIRQASSDCRPLLGAVGSLAPIPDSQPHPAAGRSEGRGGGRHDRSGNRF